MNDLKASCTVCQNKDLVTCLDLGSQPASNRFILPTSVDEKEEKYEMAFGYCPTCYTPQLTKRLPRSYVKPRFDWLTYNEPEGHLDDAVSHLAELEHLNKEDYLIGLTYKDKSTLDRLNTYGFDKTSFLTSDEFNIFEDKLVVDDKQLLNKPKFILARHVIEHADSAVDFVLSLKKYLASDGYLVLEIPSNEKVFENHHYSFLWEEHISYFTKESPEILAKAVGAELVWSKSYEYNYEDSIVFVLAFGKKQTPQISKHSSSTQGLLENFCSAYQQVKTAWQTTLKALKAQGEVIALFGAGHLGIKFINFFELAPYFDCAIDDHSEKNKHFMPGSKLPICPSSELAQRKITRCFSTLSPESEQRVRKKMQSFIDAGGDFISAFDHSVAYV